MTVTGLWFTTDNDLWVLEEISRTETFTRYIFEVKIIGVPKGSLPFYRDIKGLYLVPKLPQCDRPSLHVLSVNRGGNVIRAECYKGASDFVNALMAGSVTYV